MSLTYVWFSVCFPFFCRKAFYLNFSFISLELSSQVPRNRYWGLHPPPSLLEKVVDDGLTGIQRAIFLKKAGVETAVDDEFLQNPPSRADLLESAIKNMTRFLLTRSIIFLSGYFKNDLFSGLSMSDSFSF